MSKDKRLLIKYESQSNRVKGLSFHPKRPWILASLHNGVIQLYDYRMETLIDSFEEHDGPVRGVNFHNTQPLFVSGGDDYKIKVWNYSRRRCLFNLLGHLDYIRTVQFHHEYPWILSASDDQTIRLWNWQNRTQLQVLTGHNHYVMCAQFHPRDDLIVSASLDQTVRVWDFSGLRKKNVSIAADFSTKNQDQNVDYFGASDVVVRHVLEGHTRGVNWASFHRINPMIASGADDRDVRLWRYNDTKAWEVEVFRGHMNNVSCVLFHPRRDWIISNSEDKTVRVWDYSKIQQPQVHRVRESDRYWILDAHPNVNLFAAGHDSGLIVFKLNRERPPLDAAKRLFYYKDQFVYEYDFKTEKEKAILSTRRRHITSSGATTGPRSLHYNHFNQSQHCIILCSDPENDKDDGSYELYVFNKNDTTAQSAAAGVRADDSQQAIRGFGRHCCFISRNRFVVLDRSRQIWLKSLANESKRRIQIPLTNNNNNNNNNFVVPLGLFAGGIGRILVRTSESMILYDIQGLKVVGEIKIASRHPVKYVVWSNDGKYVAMMSKASIYIANTKFEEETSINETTRIKSGAWDPCGVFVYTTATHLKYLLPNGDNGIIRTLDTPVYITSVNSQAVNFLDREVRAGKLAIDATEYLFKVALWKRKQNDVIRIMRSKKLVGQSIIAYLQKKGFPEVALHFVQDDNIKFSLALECGNIVVALDCAKRLDTAECWHRLAQEALRQGNDQIVEIAHQKTKNFERLSFLYLLTGNVEKLSKMLQIATLREDLMGRFHNSLYLGNVQERVTVLADAGQLKLAYLTAVTHGLEEQAKQIAAVLGDKLPTLPDMKSASLLLPPVPILREQNWPLIEIRKEGFLQGNLDQMDDKKDEKAEVVEDVADNKSPSFDDDEPAAAGDTKVGWADDDLSNLVPSAPTATKEPKKAAGGEGWGDLELDIGTETQDQAAPGETETKADDGYFFPTEGKNITQKWVANSPLAADLIAAGNFDTAQLLLNRQIGVINFAALKPYFIAIHQSAFAHLPQLPLSDSLPIAIQRSSSEGKDQLDLPELAFKLAHCVETLKNAYLAVTEGKFQGALANFREIITTLPLIVVESKQQVAEVHALLEICKEYITAMKLELARKDTQDATRAASLSAYFTRCKVQPVHLVLALKVAIKCTYTAKNFKSCASLCRRVLEMCVTDAKSNIAQNVNATQIKGVLKACEKTNSDATDMQYSDTDPFVLCCETLTPIGRTEPSVKCPYCQSLYKQQFSGKLCSTCQLSKIGAEATGLRVFPN